MIEISSLTDLFDEYGIDWVTGDHENLSRKCAIGIDCPYCDDHNKHLGIFKEMRGFSCFRCKSGGTLYSLCKELMGLSFSDFELLLLETRMNEKSVSERIKEQLGLKQPQKEQLNQSIIKLPPNALKNKLIGKLAQRIMKKYLQGRPNPIRYSVAQKYNAYPCFKGKYKNRLIIPVYNELNKLAFFQARSMKKNSSLKYLNPVVDVKKLLYGLNQFKGDTAIICEGVFDCWRVGNKALGAFGTGLSSQQVELLKRLGVNHLIFAWDADAYQVGKKCAEIWHPLFDTIKVIKHPFGEDPDSLGHQRFWQLVYNTPYY